MYQRILVPVDGSETSDKGLDEALGLARLTGGCVRLIHIVDQLKYVTGFETYCAYSSDLLPLMQESGEKLLQEGRQRAERAGIPVETMMFTSLGDRVSEVVVEQANSWKADVIVIGTHGRHGVGRVLLGSDAEQILRVSPVPVLLVRAGAQAAKAGTTEGPSSTVAVAA